MNEVNIELSIPMHYFDDDTSIECPICTHALCDDVCPRASVTLTCCRQSMCSGCFSKILRRCKCSSRCQKIVGECPFCRDMCRASASDVFCGRQSACSKCRTMK